LRAQAQLYFDIAQLLTDPQAADGAMATAAKYLAQADEMEQAERISSERATGWSLRLTCWSSARIGICKLQTICPHSLNNWKKPLSGLLGSPQSYPKAASIIVLVGLVGHLEPKLFLELGLSALCRCTSGVMRHPSALHCFLPKLWAGHQWILPQTG
jgi:hypothetical protein